jgi:CDP-glycerol:poly(glycerophosphate) glycerophosphotransferase
VSWAGRQVARLDRTIARLSGRRRVVVDVRTALNVAILAPVAEPLHRDPRIQVIWTGERPADVSAEAGPAGLPLRIQPRRTMEWRRVDLCLTADAWDPIRLRRCRRRANFFHGMAGKYDLDAPGHLPHGFADFDRVAFINSDRMRRYLESGVVRRDAAVLVGYPKVDALVNGSYDAAAMRRELQLDPGRPTAIYAPTWSTASSLHIAGEEIVRNLVDTGFNVIVKLHDRSLDPANVSYSGGIDWRARFARMRQPGRIAFSEAADSSPLLAASDVMVTDHSSIGFEFYLLDRPLVIVEAPDLVRVARINPEKVALLRSAARVVESAGEVGLAAVDEIAHRDRRSAARRAIVREMFHEPGTATDRALDMVYDLLDVPPPRRVRARSHAVETAGSVS